jgi:hypothetical protein
LWDTAARRASTAGHDPHPPRREQAKTQFAIATPSHPNVDFDVFTRR